MQYPCSCLWSLQLNLPPGESLRFSPHFTPGKRGVGRTQGAGKDIRGKMRRGESKDRRGGNRVPLMSSQTSADCSVGDQEKEENENESPCFSRRGPHAHGLLPRGQACPVQDENTMRDPSLPRVRAPCGT